MARKKTVSEEDLAKTLSMLPTVPSEYAVDTLIKRGYLGCNVLLYRSAYVYMPLTDRKEKMVQVTCTACGGSAYLEYANIEVCSCSRSYGPSDPFGFIDYTDKETKVSGNTCICPCCGKGMQALHISRFKNLYEVDSRFWLEVHNVNGHLALLSFFIRKYTDKEGKVTYGHNIYDGILVINQKPKRLCGYTRNMGCGYSWHDKWEMRQRFHDNIGACAKTEINDIYSPDIWNSDSANCALDEYIRSSPASREIYPGAYMQLWCKYPHIENIVKAGFTPLLNEIIEKCRDYTANYIFGLANVKNYLALEHKKPHLMIGVLKEELPLIKDLRFDTLQFFKCKKIEGLRMTRDQLEKAERLHAMELLNHCEEYNLPIVRTLNYLTKQREKARHLSVKPDVHFMRDYFEYLERFYGEMPASMIYPKDLVAAHDDMVKRVKEKEDAAVNAKIAARLLDLNKFCFEDDETDLMIRPCGSHKEIIDEGKILNHCVGSYAKRYSEGVTNILLIRKRSEPDIPFYTLQLDIKDYHVVQNRGKNNCNRTPEVILFQKKFEEFIKIIKQKEKKANGKQLNKQCCISTEPVRAGA